MSSGAVIVRWKTSRWLFTILTLAAVQVGLIFLVSQKNTPVKARSPHARVRLLTKPFSDQETITQIIAGDPTVFVLANNRGFSGAAWLQMPVQDYATPDWDEPTRWLNLNVAELGGVFTNFLNGVGDHAVQIAEKLSPAIKDSEEAPRISTSSRFAIEGDLSSRLISSPILPVWPSADILHSSTVQVCLNGSGEVVLARLLTRSGLPVADQKAVTLAREFAFKPVNTGEGATNLVSGTIVFQWETVPVAIQSEFE
jgi:hypothetical protein